MDEKRRHMPLWLRTIRVALWTVMCVVLFVAASVACMVNVLTPEVLTPIAEKVMTAELRAQVRIGRLELTFDDNFPHLQMRMHRLAILSDDILALSAQEKRTLPAYTDTVMRIDRFTGSIDLKGLLHNTVALGNIVIDGPEINIVDVRPEVVNYDIFYESTDTASLTLPKIEMHRFSIVNPRPIRYHNLQTGTYVEVGLRQVGLDGTQAPLYAVSLSGSAHSPQWGRFNLADVAYSLDGTVRYDFAQPSHFGLEGFHASAAGLRAAVSTDIDLTEGLLVKKLEFELEPASVTSLLRYVPQEYVKSYGLDRLHTDARLAIKAALLRPYNPTIHLFPHMSLSIMVPKCRIDWDQFRLKEADLTMNVLFDGDDLNRSVIDISRLSAYGDSGAINMAFSGRATNLLADPEIEAKMSGRVDLGKLSWLPPLIRTQIQGLVTAKAEVKGRQSMLSRERFHELKATGTLDIDNFYAVTWDTVNMAAFNHARLHLGTDDTFVHGSLTAPNMLRFTADIDTGAFMHSDISMKFAGVRLGVGTTNDSQSADTTRLRPMGGSLSARSFSLNLLTDSMGVVIRQAMAYGTMTRYRGHDREPLFTIHLQADKCGAGTPEDRLLFTDAQTTIKASPRPHKKAETPVGARQRPYKAHPDIPEDSVYILALQRHNRQPHRPRFQDSITAKGREQLNFNIASGFGAILRDWNIHGDLTASRAALYTPTFPLRNRLQNINIHYSDDSLSFNNIKYKAGRSDMAISGLVSNMRSAFLSRFASPIRINVDVRSDTIDVNELADAFFRGAAYSERRSKIAVDLSALTSEADLQRQIDHAQSAAGDSAGPLLIPYNLDATLKVRANHIVYSDFVLNQFGGDVLVYHGALNLNDLHASSRVGAVTLTALYSAPTADDMTFGMGLQLKRFNIDRFLRMVPVIDTIMPVMRDIAGIIDVDIAATTDIDRQMNFVLPSLKAAIKIQGDSLVVIDPATFKSIAKWLLFRDKNKNMIDSITAQVLVEDNTLKIYPFEFKFDRYRLGVMGWMNLEDQYEYHIGVLKSPIPFKFGINIKSGKNGKMKIRLGGNKFNKKNLESYPVAIVDNTRVNLINEIKGVFRRGIRGARLGSVRMPSRPDAVSIDLDNETLSPADSALYIQEGLIPPPAGM